VASGAIARAILKTAGIDVYAYTTQIGEIQATTFDRCAIDQNLVRAADPDAAERMVAAIEQIKTEQDSLGGVVEVRADGVPPGLGEPTMDKLDALIGQAMLSIPATKGVEIGRGFEAVSMRGSQHNDHFYLDADGRVRTRTNNAGGTLGGISNGEAVIARVAIKPTSSISRDQETVDMQGNSRTILVEGRHDPCVVPRAVPVIEAMMCLVLADLYLLNRMSRVDWD
jgi:chorismate synthase